MLAHWNNTTSSTFQMCNPHVSVRILAQQREGKTMPRSSSVQFDVHSIHPVRIHKLIIATDGSKHIDGAMVVVFDGIHQAMAS